MLAAGNETNRREFKKLGQNGTGGFVEIFGTLRAASDDHERLIRVKGEGAFEGILLSGRNGFEFRTDRNAGPNIIRVRFLNVFRDRHAESDFFGFFHEDEVGKASDDIGLMNNIRDFEKTSNQAHGQANVAAFQKNDIWAVPFR